MSKKDIKKMIDFAVEASLFGASAGIMGDAAASLPAGSARNVANATTTVYAAGFLKKKAKDVGL